MRYAIYTMRRTSSRTVYAIYDTEASRPVADRNGSPLTFTERATAQRQAVAMEKASVGKV